MERLQVGERKGVHTSKTVAANSRNVPIWWKKPILSIYLVNPEDCGIVRLGVPV